MDKKSKSMDFSTLNSLPVYRETRFRTPSGAERTLGLWVDRIGAGSGGVMPLRRLRMLGQYAAVAVESGQGILRSPRIGTRIVREGDAFLLFPGEPAAYGSEDGNWYTRWVVWNGPEAEKLEQLGCLAAAQPIIRNGASVVHRVYFSLVRLLDAEDLGAMLERKQWLLRLLTELYRTHQLGRNVRPTALGEQMLVYLRENANRPLSVATAAAAFHLSPGYFRRLFKVHTGRTPRQFMTAQRISRAKELICRGMPLKQVAVETGYEDVFYFMRVFRRETGITPGRFASLNPDAGSVRE